MKIKFKQEYLSIKEFQEKEIKDFSIITGLNGSGKTHLLTGIKNEQIEVEGINPKDIVYLMNIKEKLFDVISNVFIENGAKVIMATHSPSTIAHAPEDAIM